MITMIILLLIIFGFVFYYKWAQSSLTFTMQAFREEEAYAAATVASNLPELHCSRDNVIDLNCYDTLKIKAMRTVIDRSRSPNQSKTSFFYYNSLFKNANVSVYEIYPRAGADEPDGSLVPFHVVIYDNPPAKITQKIPARIPVTLYDPITDTTRYGMIEVVRYY